MRMIASKGPWLLPNSAWWYFWQNVKENVCVLCWQIISTLCGHVAIMEIHLLLWIAISVCSQNLLLDFKRKETSTCFAWHFCQKYIPNHFPIGCNQTTFGSSQVTAVNESCWVTPTQENKQLSTKYRTTLGVLYVPVSDKTNHILTLSDLRRDTHIQFT